ncbi:hypothetical protein LAJ19_20535 (plasmid) [Deinococcus taeanensis]|uniref:hypothetical protein n=1 Tax=Deinococcus taeanensis TaxID=2737050 RepID=UPI001CDC559C|nr:hypothetical protein [Deinococcus taeanensis]UBV45198.1 hypothetical protein LAJ19_20535 [Deinococcus taeanensis]
MPEPRTHEAPSPLEPAITMSLRPPEPPAAPEEAGIPPRPDGLYPMPATTGESGDIWAEIRRGHRPLDPHRAYLKYLVAEALGQGLFYTAEVRPHIIGLLGDLLTEDMRTRNNERIRTEGGVIGMEIYYARDLLSKERERREIRAAHERIQPRAGLVLGTLIWTDGKRATGCEITAVDGYALTLRFRRGRSTYDCHCDARSIEAAQQRTREHAAARTPKGPALLPDIAGEA